MTVYAHGFDYLSTAKLLEYWDSVAGSSSVTLLQSGSARDGAQGLRIQNNLGSVQKVYFASGQNQMWAGISYRWTTGATWGTSSNIFMFTDSTGAGQCGIGIDNTTHKLVAYEVDGSTATISSGSATSTLALVAGTWYSIQCRIRLPGGTTLDEVEVIVDDGTGPVTWINCTGTFRWQANTDLCGTRIGTGSGSGLPSWDFDNLYVSNEGFKGDLRVTTLYPNGAGSNAGWATQVGGTGGTPYTAVNENPDDGDTSYLATGTLSALDTLAMQNLGVTPPSISVVQAVACLRQETSATVTVAPTMNSGSSPLIGAFKSPGTGYKYYAVSSTTDPATLAPWTLSGVNAVECGMKAGPAGTGNVRCTQVVLEVQSPNPAATSATVTPAGVQAATAIGTVTIIAGSPVGSPAYTINGRTVTLQTAATGSDIFLVYYYFRVAR